MTCCEHTWLVGSNRNDTTGMVVQNTWYISCTEMTEKHLPVARYHYFPFACLSQVQVTALLG